MKTPLFLIVVSVVGAACASEAPPKVSREQIAPSFVLAGLPKPLTGVSILTVQSDGFAKMSVDGSGPIGAEMALSRAIGSVSGGKWSREGSALKLEANFRESFPDSSEGRFRFVSAMIRHEPSTTGPGVNVGSEGASTPNPTPGAVENSSHRFYSETSEVALVVSATGSIENGIGTFTWSLLPDSAISAEAIDWSREFAFTGSGPVELSCLRVNGLALQPVPASQEPECASLFGQ